ncbi:MAG: hypothetical protein A3J29_07970 [Acidobacteria bacterium RIFCSPLOWO2_12_FULL_67_14b]|nr:MAG: hypothetical protein A3J29_07970 [Acidobacteria bacterium RIFCSPLOWO2_12_FULL_67_14b]
MTTLIVTLTESEARALAQACDAMKMPTHEAVAHEAIRILLRTLGLQSKGRPIGYRKPAQGRDARGAR